MIAWHYPLDGLRVELGRRDESRLRFEKGETSGGMNLLASTSPSAVPQPASPDAASTVGPLGMDLDDLNFGYVVLYQSRGRDGKTKRAEPPAWAPLRVFDDGGKTFVQFPPQATQLRAAAVVRARSSRRATTSDSSTTAAAATTSSSTDC